MLRRVTTKSVTVWVALKDPAKVTLTVKDNQGVEAATGSRNTVAVGVNLHIVAVTATSKPEKPLKDGIVYQYELAFSSATKSADLAGATNSASLSYTGYSLPTFSLPPANIENVRLFHGSCRMPHGSGIDALALLDVLIEQSVANATARPHQLMLTGDQIYADDVSAALLMLLTDAGDMLLYGVADREQIPVIDTTTGSLPPYGRFDGLDAAGFTSDDLRSHLMSLAEYLAMYLFTWSDVLWPPDGDSIKLPTEEVVSAITASISDASKKVKKQWKDHGKEEIEDDARDVRIHYGTLSRVRRLLANIPTCMIFDDHEITDDWNMTLKFSEKVYNSQLGRRVIQNGLVAYSLCQHWGNVPETYEQQAPGATLLTLLDAKSASDYANNSEQIQKIVGVRSQPGQRTQDAGSLVYNYTIEAAAYQLIITDTRTWRTFPDGPDTTGHFLPAQPDQLKAQVTGTPDLNGRILLVVITTNAPPTEPIRTAERHPWATTKFGGSDNPDIYDAWDLPGVPFDRLLVALTEKMPLVQGIRRGTAILMSGDVHHGFASRLKYRAKRRFEDPQNKPQPASANIVQLVASSFKKQNGTTVILHKEGYTGAPWLAKQAVSIPPFRPEGYLGYNLPAGTVVAQSYEFASAGMASAGVWKDIKLANGAPNGVPTVMLGHEDDPYRISDPKETKVVIPPDFRYRLDYLPATRQGQQPKSPPTIPALAPGVPRSTAVAVFNAATRFYRDYNYQGWSKQQIIGLNNIGETTFVLGGGELRGLNHTLRWKLADAPEFAWATYNIEIDPDDNVIYPDIKADNE